MARKRKRSPRRRARVGAMSLNSKNPIIMLAAVGVGYMVGDQINAAIDKAVPTKDVPATAKLPAGTAPAVSSTIVGAGMSGIGALLLLKGKRSLLKTAAGGLLAGAGIKRILKDQGVVSGYASVPVIARRIAGYPKVPVIGKVPGALNGYTTSRTAALGMVPNTLKGYTTSRMPILGGMDDNRMD